MARPYSMSNVTDIAANGSSSLLEGLTGRTLQDNSRVRIFANREAINVLLNIVIGTESAGQDLLAQVLATLGTKPIVPDDLIVDSFGLKGDEVVIRAQNLTGGALEARVLVFITPMGDLALQQALGILG